MRWPAVTGVPSLRGWERSAVTGISGLRGREQSAVTGVPVCAAGNVALTGRFSDIHGRGRTDSGPKTGTGRHAGTPQDRLGFR